MLKKTIATLGVAAIALIASPTAAFAAPAAPAAYSAVAACAGVPGDTYVDGKLVTSDQLVVEAGGTFTVSWHENYFAPSAAVTVSVTGNNAADATLAFANSSSATAGSSLSGVAEANGSLAVDVTLPASASGTYSVSASSDSACGGVSVTVDNGGVAGVVVNADTNSNALAFTGGTVPTVLVGTGIAAVLFGFVLLLVRSRRRLHS